MALHITARTRIVETSEADPNDRWDRPNTRTELIGLSARIVDLPVDTQYFYSQSLVCDLDVEPGGTVYVVVLRYGTGDTFGNDDGRVEIADAFIDRQTAEALVSEYEKTAPDWRQERTKRTNVPAFDFNGREYWVPWCGYFETFESVSVEELTVQR